MMDRREHFAHCIALFGGTTSASRRLGIDERAIRRFINGEKPIGHGLFKDTALALRALAADATEAADLIASASSTAPDDL